MISLDRRQIAGIQIGVLQLMQGTRYGSSELPAEAIAEKYREVTGRATLRYTSTECRKVDSSQAFPSVPIVEESKDIGVMRNLFAGDAALLF